MTENPYATPLSEPANPADQRKWSVSSGQLLVRHGAVLPRIDLLTGEQAGDLIPSALAFRRSDAEGTGRGSFRYYVSRSTAKKQSRSANFFNPVWYASFLYVLYRVLSAESIDAFMKGPSPMVFCATMVLWSLWMRLHLKPSFKTALRGGWIQLQGISPAALGQLASFETTGLPIVTMKTVKIVRLNLFRFPLGFFLSLRMLTRPLTGLLTLVILVIRLRKPTFVMDLLTESEHTRIPLNQLPSRLKELVQPWTNPVHENDSRWTLDSVKRHESPTGSMLFEILELFSQDLAHAMAINLSTQRTGVSVNETRIWSFATQLHDGTVVRTTTNGELPLKVDPFEFHYHCGASPGRAWLLHLAHIGGRPALPARGREEWLERGKAWSAIMQEASIAAGYQNPEHEMEIAVPPDPLAPPSS